MSKRGEWKKDKSERGIFLRGKSWYVKFSDSTGKIRRERVGPSKALAIKVYAKRKTEVAERRFFPGTNASFDELVKDVVAETTRRRKPGKQLLTYRYNILGKWFKGRRASSISSDEFSTKLDEHCKTPASFNRYCDSVSKIYRIGKKKNKVTVNPGRGIERKTENNTRERYLFAEEEAAIRKALWKLYPEREPEFDLALNTGMRWAEQYELTWPQVNWNLNQITLPTTKSGKKQHVHLNRSALAALKKLRGSNGHSDFVCATQKYAEHKRWFKKVLAEAKVTNFTWHDLRHTFASWLVMAKVNIYIVSALLRHGSVKTTERYAHLADEHLKQAVGNLAVPDGVSGTLGGTTPEKPIQPISPTIQ